MAKISLLIIALSLSTLLRAQPLLTKDQQKVQHTVINFFETLANRDSVNLRNYCANDVLLFEYGQVWNLDTLIRKAIRQNTATDFKRVNTIDFLTSSVDKKIAWATYNLHSDIMREGKQVTIHWMETVILVKERKRWKIKVLHSTLIKRN
ncbi:MAG: nuclear transport factor 2 family protein [Cyclobacteriaceae bacterium]|jgi:ketosteroid isomerase-like protein|nr:nuclear transport factor 2 family protein [Cyclobacteriaceae bacterium]